MRPTEVTTLPPVIALAFCFLALACVPLTLSWLPALADYPNHLARVFVLLNVHHSAALATYYEPFLQGQPNLAFDAGVAALAQVMSIWLAGKVFIVITFVTIAGGVIYLHRVVHGHWSVWPLLVFIFLYNRLLLWGYLGYLFSLGLAVWGVALFLKLRHASPSLRIAVGLAFAVAIYFGHLFAFGIYAVCIGAIASTDAISSARRAPLAATRELLISGLPFLVPVTLFVTSMMTEEMGKTTWALGQLRTLTAPFNVVHNYNLTLDIATLLILAVVVILALGRGRLRIDRRLLVPIILLSLMHLLMPDRLFSSQGADHRIPIALVFFGIAAADPTIHKGDRSEVIFAVFAGLFVLRMAVIAGVWNEADRVYGEYRAAFDHVPRGARLLSIVPAVGSVSLPSIPLFEIATVAVITREAFVPSLYAYPREPGQPLRVKRQFEPLVKQTPPQKFRDQELAALRNSSSAEGINPFRPDMVAAYDYVLLVHPRQFPISIPGSLVAEIEGRDFLLLKHSS